MAFSGPDGALLFRDPVAEVKASVESAIGRRFIRLMTVGRILKPQSVASVSPSLFERETCKLFHKLIFTWIEVK